MLIALTIMIFLILVVVSLHYNEHAKELVKIQDALEIQNKLLEDKLGSIEFNTRVIARNGVKTAEITLKVNYLD